MKPETQNNLTETNPSLSSEVNLRATESQEPDEVLNEKIEILGNTINESGEQVAGTIVETLSELESSNLPLEEKDKLRIKLEKIGKQFLSYLQTAALLAGAGFGASILGYKHTQYDVVKEGDGVNITYKHEDDLTTHNINVLCGVEDLTHEDKVEILRTDIRTRLSKAISPRFIALKDQYLDKIDAMNDEQLVIVMKKMQFEYEKIFTEPTAEFVNKYIDPQPKINDPEYIKQLYKALWELEQECDNPRVIITGKPVEGFFSFDRSSYDPFTNTIYVVTTGNPDGYKQLLAELAHAKQRTDKPALMAAQGTLDGARVITEMIVGLKSYRTAYDTTLYDQKGSIEHDAHEVIEKKLIQKVSDKTPRVRELKSETKIQEAAFQKAIDEAEKELIPIRKTLYSKEEAKREALWQKFRAKLKKHKRGTPEYEQILKDHYLEHDKMDELFGETLKFTQAQVEAKHGIVNGKLVQK